MIQFESVPPQLDGRRVTVGAGQEEFIPIEAVMVNHMQYGPGLNTAVLAFRPNAEQLAKLNAGEDLYVSLLTFGAAMQGIIVLAGKQDASAVFNVKVSE